MPNILVVGSLNTDYVIDVDKVVTKGETLLGRSSEIHFGGKGANQAVALARLGADTSMIGAVGNDEEGMSLISGLDKEGIKTKGIQTLKHILSGKAFIQRTKDDNAIVVAPGANMAFDLSIDEIDIEAYDMIVLQNEIPMTINKNFIDKAHHKGVKVLYNPAPAKEIDNAVLKKVDTLVLNESEASTITQMNVIDEKAIESVLKTLAKTVKGNVILTRGAKGVSYTENQKVYHEKAYVTHVVDTTAAGDSAVAGLAYNLAIGRPLKECITLAQKCGALAVTKKGAQPSLPTMKDVLESIFRQ